MPELQECAQIKKKKLQKKLFIGIILQILKYYETKLVNPRTNLPKIFSVLTQTTARNHDNPTTFATEEFIKKIITNEKINFLFIVFGFNFSQ